jgi:putative component of toxin-antitoxin plasmid stabilization module
MNFSGANEALNLLTDRFETMCRTDADRERWRNELMRFECEPEVLKRGITALVTDWKPNRNPTRPEISRYVERAQSDERGRGDIRAVYEGSIEIRRKYGDAYLAMFARPHGYVCADCADDYVSRGIDLSNPYLKHVHFSGDDLDGRADLVVAIADARASIPHPLESAALPRSPEATAKYIQAMRASIGALPTVAANV